MMNVETLVKFLEEMVLNGVEITTSKIQKGNTVLTGISIGYGNIRPTLCVENYENSFRVGGYELVAKEMLQAINQAELPKIDIDTISTWKYARENLILCIAPKGTNQGVVTFPYLDLELYVRVQIMEMGTYKITEELLNLWKISKEKLLMTAKLHGIQSYIIYPISFDEPQFVSPNDFKYDIAEQMYAMSNTIHLYGSGIMFHKDILKTIADKVNEDLLIFPSSIHEIIITIYDNQNMTEVNAMIHDINITEISPDEVLSNHAYIFHKDTMEITY